MRRVLLHIGYEKTGSTTLQRFLRVNRQRLADRGILYPRSPGPQNHVALAACCAADATRDELRADERIANGNDLAAFRRHLTVALESEIAGSADTHTVVFSNEHCSTRLATVEEIGRLAALVAPISDVVRVILYIRRQDALMRSLYASHVKSGGVETLPWMPASAVALWLDFDALLAKWAAVFGKDRIDLRIYDRRRLVHGDIVDDFCQAAAIPLDATFERPPDQNRGPTARTLEAIRLVNRQLQQDHETGARTGATEIAELLRTAARASTLSFPPGYVDDLMALCRPSNDRVAKAYFGGAVSAVGDPLFGLPDEHRPDETTLGITPEESIETATALMVRCFNEIRALREEVAAANPTRTRDWADRWRSTEPPGG